MPDDPEPLSIPEAENVFLDHVARRGGEDLEALEGLCARHPHLEGELRVLHAEWRELGAALDRAGDASPVPATDPRHGGAFAVQPKAEAGVRVTPAAELLRRLAGAPRDPERYADGGQVGAGGMGTVLRVRDLHLGTSLAMKVSSERSAARPSRGLARFLEEAQVTGQLDHPGIVPVHDVGLDSQGRAFFTMKLVRGKTFGDVIHLVREGREGWSLPRALGVLQRVSEAIGYAHARGVLHRDIKPANVMVGPFGEVYVMDWGLARVMSAQDGSPDSQALGDGPTPDASALHTKDGDVLGTPAYMSPEQARGQLEKIGPGTDVYAIGALLYHLLTGVPPYLHPGQPSDSFAVWRRVQSGPPKAVSDLVRDVPGELVAVCERAMARDVERRYTDVKALEEDLRAYLEVRVVRAYETGALAELKKWVRRNRPLAVALFVAFVLLVVGLVTSSVFARRASSRAADVLSLSAIQDLEDLERRAAGLWPVDPTLAEPYALWLEDARALATSLPTHRERLERLRARGRRVGGAQPRFEFTDREDRWWHGQLERLVLGLEEFTDEATGWIEGRGGAVGLGVARRLELARDLREATLNGPRAQRLWAEATASIADPAACPAYRGLRIDPMIGLLPIGRDPGSGLWEFAHLQTGSAPERDPDTGELLLFDDAGLVFVLIPGGSFQMGAQSVDPSRPNYDRNALSNERGSGVVELEPFLISKYEMTQGQWTRSAMANPSYFQPSFFEVQSDMEHSWLLPVESVTWRECRDQLQRLGLVLPTEAQWEYAARAGTDTPWWTGAERGSLRGAINIADETAARAGRDWVTIADWPGFEDGWVGPAPADYDLPNPFGLHGVHGNISEWCRDRNGHYSSPPRPGDGLRDDPDHPSGVLRGGAFNDTADLARCSRRIVIAPDSRNETLGVRPARAVARSR